MPLDDYCSCFADSCSDVLHRPALRSWELWSPDPYLFYLTPDLIPWFIFLMLDWCCVAGIGGKCASPPFVPVRPKSLRCFMPGTRQECNIRGCATVCSRNGINTHWGYCDKSTWECCCPRWCTCLGAPAVRCKRDNKISEEQSIFILIKQPTTKEIIFHTNFWIRRVVKKILVCFLCFLRQEENERLYVFLILLFVYKSFWSKLWTHKVGFRCRQWSTLWN